MPKAEFEGFVRAVDLGQPIGGQNLIFTFEITKTTDWHTAAEAWGWQPYETPPNPRKTIRKVKMTFETIEEASSSIPGSADYDSEADRFADPAEL